jgi:hypothetical protein
VVEHRPHKANVAGSIPATGTMKITSRMKQKKFANIAVMILIVVLVGAAGYLMFVKKSASPVANWKTYRNDEFGFEFKYPAELNAVSSGPNEEQKRLDRGETISGTILPFYDNITFSDQANKKQFSVIIFLVWADEISPAKFKNGCLSMGSTCDTRWIDSISEEPTLINKNGIPVLGVQVIGDFGERVNKGCYYFKNSAGNLIVFNIGIKQKSDFLNVFHLVGDKILSTLNLTK